MTFTELFQAINAELGKRGLVLNQTPHCWDYRHQMVMKGRFYVTGPVCGTVRTHVDIDAYGRELGVLNPGDVVTGL